MTKLKVKNKYPKTKHDIVVPTNANVKIAPRLRKKNLCKEEKNMY